MEEQLSLDFLRVVENAAIAAARTMGFGDRHHADEMAVEAMRKTMNSVEIDGTIVIGEGERDEAPMLYIGEKVGLGTHAPKALFPQVDIAVDPLEGTNLCVMGAGGAPEGVLAAAALRCLNGQILARLVVSKPEHAERLSKMGVKDLKRVYDTEDLAPGKKMIFACTGVTDGNLLKGVRFFGEGVRTSSMILTLDERQGRFIDSVHLDERPDLKARFNCS